MLSDSKRAAGTIDYRVLATMSVLTLLFVLANALEPQVDAQLDLFELVYLVSSGAQAVFCFVIATRYQGSKVFGKAYLALAIGFLAGFLGDALFQYYQLSGISNPYPYYPDIFYSSFFPFAFYHLYRNIRLFKPKLDGTDKTLIVMIPVTITLLYLTILILPISVSIDSGQNEFDTIQIGDALFLAIPSTEFDDPPELLQRILVGDSTYYLVPVENTLSRPEAEDQILHLIPVVVSNLTIGDIPTYDAVYWSGLYMGTYYTASATIITSLTLVGLRTYRNTILGVPWGLLVAGISLGTAANVIYSITSIVSYDRTSPILGLWVLGYWVVCYALYLHRKQL